MVVIHHGPGDATGRHQRAERADADRETGVELVGVDFRRELLLRLAADVVVRRQRVVVAAGGTGDDRAADHGEHARSRHPAPFGDRGAVSDGRRLHVRDRHDQRRGRQDHASAVSIPHVPGGDAGGRVELEARHRRLDAGVVQAVEAQGVAAVGLDHLRCRADETAGGDLAGGTGADGERVGKTRVRHVVGGDAVALLTGVEQPERARGDRSDGLGQVGEGETVAEHLEILVATLR